MINHKVVMFAGSMGGHFVELMCLHTLFSKYESVLVTDNLKADKSDKRIASFKSIAYSTAWAKRRENTAGVKNTRSRWQNAFTYFKMFMECFTIYIKYRPAVIVSTGSYIAVPLFIAGKICGSKLIFIESNAMVYSKTTTGKLVEKLADAIYVQWPEMLNVYPKATYCGTLY